MTGAAHRPTPSPDSSAGSGAWARAPWLLVVARGHARLVTELRVMFRDDPRVQVIENRREDHALLPRGTTIIRRDSPTG